MAQAQNQAAVRPTARNVQMPPTPDSRRQNSGHNAETPHHQANLNITHYEATAPYNAWEEVDALLNKMEDSQYWQDHTHNNLVPANKRASKYKSQLDKLHMELTHSRKNAETTIQYLREQLRKARGNKPDCETEECSTQTTETSHKAPYNMREDNAILRQQLHEAQYWRDQNHKSLVAANQMISEYKTQADWYFSQLKLCRTNADETIQHFKDQLKEACSKKPVSKTEDSSTQTTEASHIDSAETKCAREADSEAQNRKQQEQIEQLQKQLLTAQQHLEEEAAKHREDRERLHCEINELKAKFCTNESLGKKSDLKAQNMEQELQKTKDLKMVEEQQQRDSNITNQPQQAEASTGSLQQSLSSLQESLQREQEKNTILTTKLEELEVQTKYEAEKKARKKKWPRLPRLFK